MWICVSTVLWKVHLFQENWVHEGSESHKVETVIGSINVLWMHCVGYHCWFSSLSLFSVLILSKWNAILKLLLSLYLCIWYHCCFYFFCRHVIQCLRHVTISLLLGSMFEILRVCVRAWLCPCICILNVCTACIVNICNAFCASRSDIIVFQGFPIILICWNVKLSKHHPYYSNSRLELALPWHRLPWLSLFQL